MSNIEIYAKQINGDVFPVHSKDDNCSSLIELLFGDDFGAEITVAKIIVSTKCGKEVIIAIPNDSSQAVVSVDNQEL